MGLDTTRWPSSINSTVAAYQTSLVTPKASPFKNGIEDLAGSAALVRFEIERIFAARKISCFRCNEPSAPRNLALGTAVIEVQGSFRIVGRRLFECLAPSTVGS